MNTKRPPRSTRTRILTRDQYRCADCSWRRGPWPEGALQVDHDQELSDGGSNDDDNLITRCTDHHAAKTEERRLARAARARGDRPAKQRAATAVLPDRPRFPYRGVGAAALAAVGATLAWYGLTGNDTLWPTLAWVGILFGACVAHTDRTRAWIRRGEAQRVYNLLCPVIGAAPAARQLRFKVTEWHGGRVMRARIRPGRALTDDELTDLLEAWCGAVGWHGGVHGTGARGGWIDLATTSETVDQEDPEVPEPDPEPVVTADLEPVVTRVRDGLNAVIDTDTGKVAVREWAGSRPVVVDYTYPPRATSKVGENLVRIRDTMTRLYPPTTEGEWYMEWVSAEDRLRLADRPDPLAPVVPLPALSGDLDLYAGVPIGVTEGGDPWRIPLMGGSQWLVAGATGAGKGSVLWGIVRALAPLISDGRARLWVVDPKGGLEFHAAEPFAHRFAVSPVACAELLEDARATMLRKAASTRGQGRAVERPTRERPLDLLIVDELANVTAYVDSKVGKANGDAIAALCSMGRAAGFTVVAAVQDPRKEVVRNRGLFTGTIALRLSEPTEVNLVLGAGVRAQGATADLIPKAHPGIGYMVRDGHAGAVRARAAFVSDDEIARIAALCTRAPVEHARATTGEQLALEPGPAQVRIERAHGRVILPDDKDPAVIVRVEPDPDEPDDRVQVTYVYDGETQEREASFDRDEEATCV